LSATGSRWCGCWAGRVARRRWKSSSSGTSWRSLRRQSSRPKLTRADRALLASLSRSLARPAWAVFPIKPETLLRWHRQLIARRWTHPHRKPGRPPLERSLRELILRLAHENPRWGYKPIVGELKGLGVSVSATSVRKVLLEAGLRPAPQRAQSSWRAFLRAQASSTLACDFLTVETAFLQRIYVLFFISLGTRRTEYVACTPAPDDGWVAQQARNLVMQLGDEHPFRILVHDRDTKFSQAFHEVSGDSGHQSDPHAPSDAERQRLSRCTLFAQARGRLRSRRVEPERPRDNGWLARGSRCTPGARVGSTPTSPSVAERLAFAAPPLIRRGPVSEALLSSMASSLRIDRAEIIDAAWADNGPGWVAVFLESADGVLALEPGFVEYDLGVVG
jgi:hypothetical protein